MFFNSPSFCDTPSSHIDPVEIILIAQHCQWTQEFGAMGVASSASKPLASSCGEEETVVNNLILFHCTLQQLPLQVINLLVSIVLVHQGSTRAYTGQCVDRWGWGIFKIYSGILSFCDEYFANSAGSLSNRDLATAACLRRPVVSVYWWWHHWRFRLANHFLQVDLCCWMKVCSVLWHSIYVCL